MDTWSKEAKGTFGNSEGTRSLELGSLGKEEETERERQAEIRLCRSLETMQSGLKS